MPLYQNGEYIPFFASHCCIEHILRLWSTLLFVWFDGVWYQHLVIWSIPSGFFCWHKDTHLIEAHGETTIETPPNCACSYEYEWWVTVVMYHANNRLIHGLILVSKFIFGSTRTRVHDLIPTRSWQETRITFIANERWFDQLFPNDISAAMSWQKIHLRFNFNMICFSCPINSNYINGLAPKCYKPSPETTMTCFLTHAKPCPGSQWYIVKEFRIMCWFLFHWYQITDKSIFIFHLRA